MPFLPRFFFGFSPVGGLVSKQVFFYLFVKTSIFFTYFGYSGMPIRLRTRESNPHIRKV